MERKKAIPLGEALLQFLQTSPVGRGNKLQCIFRAWDEASGAAAFTSRRFFRDGTLFITLNSSVLRSQLFLQREALIGEINAIIAADPLYCGDDAAEGPVKQLVIK